MLVQKLKVGFFIYYKYTWIGTLALSELPKVKKNPLTFYFNYKVKSSLPFVLVTSAEK